MGHNIAIPLIASALFLSIDVYSRILLWDHSARLVTTENLALSNWLDYSEGSSVTLPFSEWTRERMIQENTTSLFIHTSFLMRDTSTQMLSMQGENDDVVGCLVDAQPLPSMTSDVGYQGGFKIRLQNRGTWSSVLVDIPGLTSLFVKTIIVPYSETDVDVRIDFLRNDVYAEVRTRNRLGGGSSAYFKSSKNIVALNLWPELLTMGVDRWSSNRLDPRTDWEVYSTSIKMGKYDDAMITEKEQALRSRGQLLYRMSDPPIRFPKTVMAKVIPGVFVVPSPTFVRIAFSFTLTTAWRTWYDMAPSAPFDYNSPSLLCMVRTVNTNTRLNMPFPVGLRVWAKPDAGTNDSYINVEIGDGTQLSNRVQIAWPPVQSGVKYNAEFIVFFQANGDADESRLPLFRFAPAPEDQTASSYVAIPKIAAGKVYPSIWSWVTSSATDFNSIVVGGPCKGLSDASAVLMDMSSFVVESIEFTSDQAFPVDAIRLVNATNMISPPVQLLNSSAAPPPPPGIFYGSRRVSSMRGGLQRDSPRLVRLANPLNFTTSRTSAAYGLVIYGEFLVQACQILTWARNDTETATPPFIPNDLPLITYPGFLRVSVDCKRNLQLIVTIAGNEYTDSRFTSPLNTLKAFRINIQFPDESTSTPDSIEIGLLGSGTFRRTLTERLPRVSYGNLLWLGRNQVDGRASFGARGWSLRNVEITSFLFAPCAVMSFTEQCLSYVGCGWVNKVGCRPTPVGLANLNATTTTPTIQSQTPTLSPTSVPSTSFPTVSGFQTASPTPASSVISTTQPTSSPVITREPTNVPTYAPVNWEYEFVSNPPTPPPTDLEYEVRITNSPSIPSNPPDATFRPTNQDETISPSITRSPSVEQTNKPTSSPILMASASPTPSQGNFPETQTPTAKPSSGTSSPSTYSGGGFQNPDGDSAASISSSDNTSGIAAGTTFAVIALAGLGIVLYRRRNHRSTKLIQLPFTSVIPKPPTKTPKSASKLKSPMKSPERLSVEIDFDLL